MTDVLTLRGARERHNTMRDHEFPRAGEDVAGSLHGRQAELAGRSSELTVIVRPRGVDTDVLR